MAQTEQPTTKRCVQCHEWKPLSDFLRRTGKRSGPQSRRGTCRSCRKTTAAKRKPRPLEPGEASEPIAPVTAAGPEPAKQAASSGARDRAAHSSGRSRGARRKESSPARAARPKHSNPPAFSPSDPGYLKETRQGTIRMRGKTDKGRRWYQEITKELAVTLVKEKAAVVVNRHTIKRLFSNKDFRKYILTRDHYTCYFCGEYGDTIDHLLPRAKGGHTTPDNCVCACNVCNQSKADKDLEQFMREI
ncbi:HNH endonuclease [Paenibacillus thailandensis]|uniref:HNH endonuclease n=1 Tax=Paenibacillus thailandensis TaxID=393250 RepID=A0ABW5QRH6_9BACL